MHRCQHCPAQRQPLRQGVRPSSRRQSVNEPQCGRRRLLAQDHVGADVRWSLPLRYQHLSHLSAVQWPGVNLEPLRDVACGDWRKRCTARWSLAQTWLQARQASHRHRRRSESGSRGACQQRPGRRISAVESQVGRGWGTAKPFVRVIYLSVLLELDQYDNQQRRLTSILSTPLLSGL